MAAGWNFLDFVVVVLGWVEVVFSSMGNMTAIRSVRLLRPLRTITKIEKMRVSVGHSEAIKMYPRCAIYGHESTDA